MVIKTEFGFKTILIGDITIYTGKIKFKDIIYTDSDKRIKIFKDGKYTTISYETLDFGYHEYNIQKLGRVCKRIAQARLNQKYGWVNI